MKRGRALWPSAKPNEPTTVIGEKKGKSRTGRRKKFREKQTQKKGKRRRGHRCARDYEQGCAGGLCKRKASRAGEKIRKKTG